MNERDLAENSSEEKSSSSVLMNIICNGSVFFFPLGGRPSNDPALSETNLEGLKIRIFLEIFQEIHEYGVNKSNSALFYKPDSHPAGLLFPANQNDCLHL